MSSSIGVATITGSFPEMGNQYGSHFKSVLPKILKIILDYFCVKHGLEKATLLKEANALYKRFPQKYQKFIVEAAKSSDMLLDDMKILNSMETFISLIKQSHIGNCSFVGIPKSKSKTGGVLVGRNYDYPKPFDLCVKYLSVVVFNETGKLPTAVVTIPGQIYCPTGFNSKGIYCSLNNGMESGGKEVNKDSTSILTSLLDGLQRSESVGGFSKYLDAIATDFSLIINSADSDNIYSHEISSFKGIKSFCYQGDEVFISTNFFQHCDWNLPQVDNKKTGYSITRYDNLKHTTKNIEYYDVDDIKALLDCRLRDEDKPGATWKYTIYQVVYDPELFLLYIKRPQYSYKWYKLELGNYF